MHVAVSNRATQQMASTVPIAWRSMSAWNMFEWCFQSLPVHFLADRAEGVCNFSPAETLIGILPFFHIYGQVTTMLLGLCSGTHTTVLPKFEPELYLAAVEKQKVTEEENSVASFGWRNQWELFGDRITKGMFETLVCLHTEN